MGNRYSVSLLYGRRYRSAFLFLEIAFAFKAQTVFIVPFILYLYILKKDFSLLNFLWSVLSFGACGIPAYIAGRGIFDTFEAYVSQVEAGGAMWFNFPSFWRGWCSRTDFSKKTGTKRDSIRHKSAKDVKEVR